MSWNVTARHVAAVKAQAPQRLRVTRPRMLSVKVPPQGPPGPKGADGDGVADPGDLTLIFNNHLV